MLVQFHENCRGWHGQNWCSQPCDGTLNMTVSKEWSDGVT